jgi:hypothetical protein
MQTEVTKVSLWTKIHKAKMSIGKVVKNSTNPHFKKSYADINALLETVEPILHENGLLLIQPIWDGVLHTLIIDIETGEMVDSWLTLPDNIDPQKMISATTYYRRATLQSLLSLQAVDDDGNSASASAKPSLTDDRFKEALKSIESGKYTAEKLKADFTLTKQQIQAL